MTTITLSKKLTGDVKVELSDDRIREIFYKLKSDKWMKEVYLGRVTLVNEDEIVAVVANNSYNGRTEFYNPETGDRMDLKYSIAVGIPFSY